VIAPLIQQGQRNKLEYIWKKEECSFNSLEDDGYMEDDYVPHDNEDDDIALQEVEQMDDLQVELKLLYGIL